MITATTPSNHWDPLWIVTQRTISRGKSTQEVEPPSLLFSHNADEHPEVPKAEKLRAMTDGCLVYRVLDDDPSVRLSSKFYSLPSSPRLQQTLGCHAQYLGAQFHSEPEDDDPLPIIKLGRRLLPPLPVSPSRFLYTNDELSPISTHSFTTRPETQGHSLILSLPREIQSLIFDFCLPTRNDCESVLLSRTSAFRLAWICGSWRDIIMNDIRFWPVLHISFKDGMLNHSKRLTELRTLDAEEHELLGLVFDVQHYDCHNYEHFWLANAAWGLLPLATRSVDLSLDWKIKRHIQDVPSTRSAGLSQLLCGLGVNDRLHSFSYRHIREYGEFGSGVLDNPLRSFPLGLGHPWTSLRSLSLDCDLSLDFCHSVLLSCHDNIERLSLKTISGPSNVSGPRLSLDRLCELELGFSSNIKDFIGRFATPSLSTLELWGDSQLMDGISDYPFNWVAIQNLILHCDAPLHAALNILRQTTGLQSLEWFGNCFSSGSLAIGHVRLPELSSLKVHSLCVDQPLINELLDHNTSVQFLDLPSAMDLRNQVNIRSLTLTCPITTDQCLQFLAQTPEIESASFHLYSNASRKAASPRAKFAGPLRLPHLERLGLTYHSVCDDITKCLSLPQSGVVEQYYCSQCSEGKRCLPVMQL